MELRSRPSPCVDRGLAHAIRYAVWLRWAFEDGATTPEHARHRKFCTRAASTTIDVAEIQKVGGLPVRGQVALRQLKPYPLGIVMSLFRIVDGQCQPFRRAVFRANGVAQVRGERRDPTSPR